MKEWRRDAERDDPASADEAFAPGKRTLTDRLYGQPEWSRGAAPGKQTLTSRLAGAATSAVATQRRAAPNGSHAATEDPAAVHAQAAVGVSGSGTELPFRELIERAFGFEHDLSDIRAHVGGAAAAAAEAIGATAYATGNDIAFASAPDLHTAAHEAAHVVQQRAGVQLHGGVGQDGDAYERHADAVADRVVAGQSAADLLASGPARGPGTAVQRRRERRAADAPAPAGPDRDLAKAVDRVETAATALQLALQRPGPIDAPTAAFEIALDSLAAAVHRQQTPSRAQAAAVRRVLARAEEVIRAVGARHQSAHPTLDRLAVALRAHVDKVTKAAAEPGRQVNAARLRVHAEHSVEQLAGAVAALKNAGAGQTPALEAAHRQAGAWAEALRDPDSPAAQATATGAGRAIEQQFEVVRLIAPRVAEITAAARSYSTGSALTALEAALGASSQPAERLAAARARAEVAYQQWKLDQAKNAIDATADSEATLGSLGRRPSGANKSFGQRWQELEADANRGQLDQAELEELTVEAEELAVYRNAQVVIAQCQQLDKILGSLDGDEAVRTALRGAAAFTQSLLDKFGKRRRDDVSHRRAAIAELHQKLGEWVSSHDFMELLGGLDDDGRAHEGRAVAAIRSAQTKQTIKAIVKTIVITLATMGIAVVAAGLSRVAVLRLSMAGDAAVAAERVSLAVGVITEVVVSTAAQKLLLNEQRSVVTLGLINAAMPLVTSVVGGAISRMSGIAASEARFFEHFHITAPHLALDAVAGAMTDYAISKIRGEPAATPENAADWLIAGACIGFARGLAANARAVRAMAAIHNAAFDFAYKKLGPLLPEADALVARINAAAGPDELAAIQATYERLVAAELKVLDAEVAHPDPKRAHAGRTLAREQNRRSKRVDDAVDAKARDLAAEAAAKPSGESEPGASTAATDDETGTTSRGGESRGEDESRAPAVSAAMQVDPPSPLVARGMKAAGMTKEAVEAVLGIAKAFKARISFRPTNKHAAAQLAKGAEPKPESIKANTVNELDVHLGMPEEKLGLVAHWKGWRLPENIGSLDVSDPPLAKRIRDRYAERMASYDKYAAEMDSLVKQGDVKIEDGIVHNNRTGNAYTGDYDLYAITELDGTPIREGSPRYEEIAEKLKESPVRIQHGPLTDWDTNNPRDAARKQQLIEMHEKAQDIVNIGPEEITVGTRK